MTGTGEEDEARRRISRMTIANGSGKGDGTPRHTCALKVLHPRWVTVMARTARGTWHHGAGTTMDQEERDRLHHGEAVYHQVRLAGTVIGEDIRVEGIKAVGADTREVGGERCRRRRVRREC